MTERVLPLAPLVHGRTAEDVEAHMDMDNLMSSLGVDQRCKIATVAAASSKRSMASSVTHAEDHLPANLSSEAKSQTKNSKKDREDDALFNSPETGSLERMNLISSTYRRVKSATGNEICYDISEKSGPGYHEKLITTEVSRKRNPSASECETNGNNPKEEEDIQSNKLTKSLGLVIAPDWLCATTQQNTRQREVNGWLTHAIPAADELDNSSAHSQGDSCEPVADVIELISIKLAVINNCTKGSLPNYS